MLFRSKEGKGKGSFNFVKIFPWFVLGFVCAALLNSFVALPPELPRFLAQSGKFLIVMAMAAIGLSTNIKNLVHGGRDAILLGLSSWIAVALVSLLVQHLTGVL